MSGAAREPTGWHHGPGRDDPVLPGGAPLAPRPLRAAAPLDVRLDVCADGTLRGARVVAVAGEVDLATAPQLGDALADLLAVPGPDVVLDLSEVTLLASRGIAVLVDAHVLATARGVGLRLVVTRPQVRRVLELTGLLAVLPCHATRADAVAP